MNARKIINDNKKQTTLAVRTAALEALEQRQLMSVSWNAGALTVNGSNGNDTIVVDSQPSIPGFSMIRVRENGAVTQNWTPYQNSKGLTVYGNAGNDTIDLSALKFGAVVFGGANNDTIKGTPAADALYGNDGDDTIYGNAGNDTLDGGANDDTLVGGAGADALWGGAGTDTASYAERTNPVYVTLDGAANDGEFLEQDNAHTDVENIVGGIGNDILTGSSAANYIQGNGGSDLIHGLSGKDTLFGGMAYGNAAKNNNGVDQLFGDAGDDNLWAPGGGRAIMHGGSENDALYGSPKNDELYGDAGNDSLYGGGGDDNLYGGMGTDYLSGGDGNDVLVTVGGGTNSTLHGDGNNDSFWLDNYAAETTDATPGETAAQHEHRIANFQSYRIPKVQNGQVTFQEVAVGTDPKGESLADPLTTPGAKWKNFSDQPLFAAAGPAADDIHQGAIGDCWFASTLSGIARKNPDYLRQRVVALGDGSFAVRFFSGGLEKYVRVDGDLPIDDKGDLLYLKRGAGNSIWAAIMEKAEAFNHMNLGTYTAVDGGNPFTAMNELGGAGVDSQHWSEFADGTALLNRIDELQGQGNVVGFSTFEFAQQQTAGPIVPYHVYSVVKVNRTKDGTPVTITIRNPWGVDGVNRDANPNDGLVTLTAHEAWVAISGFAFGKF